MSNALWFPDAIRKPIPAGENDPAIIPIGNIFHVAVSEAPSLHDFFDGRSGGIESHGYIRRDGTVEQYRDAGHEADANYLGNSFVRNGRRYGYLSWETQGMGPGEWTPEQIATIKRIIAWSHAAHDVPLRTAPAWDQPGNGYHTLYSQWSNVPGKTCPGPDRIKQYHSTIEPWMTSGAATQEDDMALDDKALEQIAQAVWAKKIGGDDNRKPARLHLIQAANASLRNEKVRDQLAALQKAVADLPEGATKAEIRRMLDHLDAEIQIVVNDPEES